MPQPPYLQIKQFMVEGYAGDEHPTLQRAHHRLWGGELLTVRESSLSCGIPSLWWGLQSLSVRLSIGGTSGALQEKSCKGRLLPWMGAREAGLVWAYSPESYLPWSSVSSRLVFPLWECTMQVWQEEELWLDNCSVLFWQLPKAWYLTKRMPYPTGKNPVSSKPWGTSSATVQELMNHASQKFVWLGIIWKTKEGWLYLTTDKILNISKELLILSQQGATSRWQPKCIIRSWILQTIVFY